jgi:hypothetical protein
MTGRVVAAMAVASFLAGCAGDRHLTKAHGESAGAAFKAQQASPAPATTPPVTDLDSQEAAIISGSYRRGLAPKGTNAEEESVIFVAPQKAAPRAPPPPPSVPK